jgi:hypothetical protein
MLATVTCWERGIGNGGNHAHLSLVEQATLKEVGVMTVLRVVEKVSVRMVVMRTVVVGMIVVSMVVVSMGVVRMVVRPAKGCQVKMVSVGRVEDYRKGRLVHLVQSLEPPLAHVCTES